MGTQGTVKIDLDDLEVEIDQEDRTPEDPEPQYPVLRRSFRVPVEMENRIRVSLEGRGFRVSNVSENGLQILLQKEHHFRAGQTIDPVLLSFGDAELHLKGRVAYVDQIDCGQFALGLELLFVNREQQEICREHHKELRNGFLRR